MEYHFNKELAIAYGLDEAVFIHNLVHWIEKNKANKKHFHNGTFWTYNSISAFCELFPFWTKKQIERILKSLLDSKVIISCSLNKKGYDRTKWYAIVDDFIFECYLLKKSEYWPIAISPNGEMDFSEKGNGVPQKGKPIPDSKEQIVIVSKDTNVELSSFKKCELFIEAFNKIRNSKYRANDSICQSLNNRLKKYNTKQIFAALKSAMQTEYHKNTKFRYLTPEFMLRETKIELYLNSDSVDEPSKPAGLVINQTPAQKIDHRNRS